jgi:trehalose 6-phosphate synthase/phosphatase
LCADLIGFQTYDYARHFISALKRILDLDFQTMPGGALGIIYSGRSVTIRINHVGIPVNIIKDLRVSENVLKKAVEFKLKHESRKIIIAVDDLDPVKGTLCKIQSYGMFLERYPEWVDKVVLLNVLSGSSASEEEQDHLRKQILAEVDDIHLKYGPKVLEIVDGNTISFDELVALYSVSEVGLFSTFWDGLNVCPYEYTASQDPENPGALIVSEFMGCSRSLSGVTSVNPWKLDQVGEAIYTSLNMSAAERRAHHSRRAQYVMKHAFTDWCSGFLTDLDEASLQAVNLNYIQVGWGSNARLIALNTGFSHLEESEVTPAYRASKKRLLLLDYDGTLTAESNPELAAPGEQLMKVLRVLSEDPYNSVFILSGRERSVLEKWFGCLPKLGLAAEKGVYYKWPDSAEWQNAVSVKDFEWKKAVKQLMKAYTERTDGTYIEPKESALVWHYEGADPEYGKMQASELAKYLQKVVEGWHGVDYNRILEVKPKGISKGVTTQRILRQLQKNGETPQFIFAVGDDRSDEEVFLALQETLHVPADAPTPSLRSSLPTSPVRGNEAEFKESNDTQLFTICVGIKPSNARFYLNDPQDVVNVLTSLSVLSAKFLRRIISPEGAASPVSQ